MLFDKTVVKQEERKKYFDYDYTLRQSKKKTRVEQTFYFRKCLDSRFFFDVESKLIESTADGPMTIR